MPLPDAAEVDPHYNDMRPMRDENGVRLIIDDNWTKYVPEEPSSLAELIATIVASSIFQPDAAVAAAAPVVSEKELPSPPPPAWGLDEKEKKEDAVAVPVVPVVPVVVAALEAATFAVVIAAVSVSAATAAAIAAADLAVSPLLPLLLYSEGTLSNVRRRFPPPSPPSPSPPSPTLPVPLSRRRPRRPVTFHPKENGKGTTTRELRSDRQLPPPLLLLLLFPPPRPSIDHLQSDYIYYTLSFRKSPLVE